MAWNRHAIAQMQLRKHVASMAFGALNLISTQGTTSSNPFNKAWTGGAAGGRSAGPHLTRTRASARAAAKLSTWRKLSYAGYQTAPKSRGQRSTRWHHDRAQADRAQAEQVRPGAVVGRSLQQLGREEARTSNKVRQEPPVLGNVRTQPKVA